MSRKVHNPFYDSPEWRRLRKEVLAADKFECQLCKEHGLYKRANHVHHVNYLEQHPELALEKLYTDSDGNVKRNLISLCHDCHEKMHNYRAKPKPVLIPERW